MLHHKSFIKKASEILDSIEADGRAFLFYADITDFQQVNENYGIEKGDRLLEAAEKCLAMIPQIAVFERVISDQFLFLAVTEEVISPKKITAAYQYFSMKFLQEQGKIYPACTLKIACGIYPIKTESIIEAIDGANAARKESKRNGSSSAVWYDRAVLTRISEYHKREHEIYLALQNQEFLFYLQPKVDLITGEITGAEALARQVKQDGTIIAPDAFVGIMEANGSVVELDLLIYRQVCGYLADRLQKGLPVVRTSVNLSRLHIKNQETAALLHSIAEEYGIPPHLLEFELTETILLKEFSGTKELIDQIRGYGYHVSIDDFGAGYAGINIWQDLSFDVLKLDRRFLAEEEPLKSRNEAIVPNVINIAQRLDTSVLCEGVESEKQCRYLIRLGCTTVQGFYFSKPVPPEQFYETYEKLDGHYTLEFKAEESSHEQKDEDQDRERMEFRHQRKQRSLLVFTCFLTVAAALLWMGIQIYAAISYAGEKAYVMILGPVILVLLLFMVCISAYFYFRKWRTKLNASEQRYLLLGQFSDTVLFDYDCKRDFVHFTPNAPKLLKIHDYEQKNFLRRLNDRFIYPGDCEIAERMLKGKGEGDENEIRIRLLRPSGASYFWCLIQFRYIYEENEIVSVIGKIIDIDDQKKKEDKLVEELKLAGETPEKKFQGEQ